MDARDDQGSALSPPVLRAHAPALPAMVLALQGPDSPNGNWLGYLIVFFMVVWPILRGVVNAANERRKEFVERELRRQRQEARARGEVPSESPPPAPVDPFERLRRLLSGEEEPASEAERRARPRSERSDPRPAPARRDRAGKSAERRSPARPAQPPRHVVVARQPGSDVPEIAIERDEGAYPRRLPEGEGGLVGDPFDDRLLERPLVVPERSEPHPAGAPERSASPATRLAREIGGALGDIGAGLPKVAVLRGTAARGQGARGLAARGAAIGSDIGVLGRVARRVRTPWGQAIAYEELLGPPVALRDSRW